MNTLLIEKARTFDKNGRIKTEVDAAIDSLRTFREKYPFAENPESIETLSPEDVFKEQTNEVGEFFHWLEYYLKPIGHLRLYSNVFRQIRIQFEDFKELLYVVVDDEKTLAKKVDAPWRGIRGMGGDKHIAKKIIFCFNFEKERVIPIFSTSHIEYFLSQTAESLKFPSQYENMTLGERYEFFDAIIKLKESSPLNTSWNITYFCRFLYDTIPPPEKVSSSERIGLEAKIRREQQLQFSDFMNLLNELRSKDRISAEELRHNRKLWEENPEGRKTLLDQLALRNK